MGYPALEKGSGRGGKGGKDVQQGDKAEGEEDETAKVSQAPVSKHAAAAVTVSIAPWIGIVEIIIRLGVIWREIGAPGFGVG